MESILVSIIMPVKNAGTFLTECLNSVENQSFGAWELIAIDDHSTDSSYAILKDFENRNTRIRTQKNVGEGIISALQTGYKHSKGQLLTRMDADDIMHRHKLKWMVESWTERGAGHLILGLVEYFSTTELGDGYRAYAQWLNHLTRLEYNFSEIYKECSIPSPCWLVHRDDFNLCGGFNHQIYPEDYDLAFRFRKGGLRVHSVDKVIHYWRDYPERTSRNDPNYAQNLFASLKIHHFLDQDFQALRPLILWGTGRKGKAIAKELQNHNVPFHWVTNNPKKIGHYIYDVEIESLNIIENTTTAQIIIAISSRHQQESVKSVVYRNRQHNYFRFS